ncbi:MAG: alpha-ketoacid dehydrogenase subunit beta [Candidatus Tectomicrobia bacterium]|nr:alpha-ketoacid dehydrogenase subunit beta [Candidatus Tectomicrobia bacterium]
MSEMTYAEAKAAALRQVLEEDERVTLIGSSFFGLSPFRRLTDSLPAEYPTRVYKIPIAELGACGCGVGAAMAGLRPIVDISTASFIFEAWPQVVNEAPHVHYMSGGRARAPVVFHVLHGLRGGGAAQHSHSPQSMLWNTPGLEIVLPASPADVKGLLISSVRSDNPTVFLDQPVLFGMRGEVPEGDAAIPLGKAEVKRAGKDVTVVATSAAVQQCLKIAAALAGEGIDVEVVDPRTLVPFDAETIYASVGKTGRLVIVDETHQSCGVASEIAARVAEEAFDALRGPIRRVCTEDVPIPFAPVLETAISPNEEKIIRAIKLAVGAA